MKTIYFLLFALLVMVSCDSFGQMYDGPNCADVSYYNPNSGTQLNYVSTIEVNSKVLQKVNFPNGWLDEDEFGYLKFNSNGSVSFNTDKGYKYTVKVTRKGTDCY